MKRMLTRLTLLLCLAVPAFGQSFRLTPQQRVDYDGVVFDAEQPDRANVQFRVLPPMPIVLKPYYNPFTGLVETRPAPGREHAEPVLRANHVRVYTDRPDAARLAIDQVATFPNEATLNESSRFAVVGDFELKQIRVIELNGVTIPQDKTSEWVVAGAMSPLKLVDHFDDPLADRGRAVEAKTPMKLTGTLLYGTRAARFGPARAFKLPLGGTAPANIGDFTEPRFSASGNVVDRVNMRELVVTDAAGKQIADLKLEVEIADEFTISPDGKRLAYFTQRMLEQPDALPKRQYVTLVTDLAGKPLGEFVDHAAGCFLGDGQLILTKPDGSPGLFVGTIASGKVEPLALRDGPEPQMPRQPTVSPDGAKLAYVSRRGVFVVGTDGRGWTPVWTTATQEPQGPAAFSPDGRFVAIVVVPLNVMNGPGEVIVIDLERHERQSIPAAAGADNTLPLVWTR
jgi:hypothetical protein